MSVVVVVKVFIECGNDETLNSVSIIATPSDQEKAV